MEKLVIEETSKTPSITLDFETGILSMKGRSIPENSLVFFQPVLQAMDRYVADPKAITNVNIQLDYFSTSSSKCILDIFKRLELIHKQGNQVTINWLYEEKDDNIRDAGIDYETMVNVPFKVVPIKE